MTDKKVIKLAQGLITDFKCDSEMMVDFCNTVIKKFKQEPCESCREQVLKHLEKEDWADTVNCVMNMPFMKGEEVGVLDKIRTEIEQLRIHKAQFITNDNKVCIDSQEVFSVIDKYKAESEE